MENLEVYETTEKSAKMLMDEIAVLDKLYTRRRHWLTEPANQRRSTYKAIEADTANLGKQLDELRAQLDNRIKK